MLAIDHIKGGGNKHRQSIGTRRGGYTFYHWLRKCGYPTGFRVLCHNCNQSSSILGICEHMQLICTDELLQKKYGRYQRHGFTNMKEL